MRDIPLQLRDFRNFLSLVWRHLGLPKPTRAQYALAKRLQYGPAKQINECFRGMGKSWICAAFVIWLLWQDRTLNILVVSGTDEKAKNFTNQCLKIIQTFDLLADLIPDRSQWQSSVKFSVQGAPISQNASLFSASVMGTTVGSRADVVIADDVEVPRLVETVMMREKLLARTEEFTAFLKPEGPGRIIYLGTPHTEDSIYTTVHKVRQTSLWIWPVRYPDSRLREHFSGNLAEELAEDLDTGAAQPGEPTEPVRFGNAHLESLSLDFSRAGWALQFMLDTSLADEHRYPLKLSDLIVMDLDPEVAPERILYSSNQEQMIPDLPVVGLRGDRFFAPLKTEGIFLPYQGSVLAVDPSGRGGDETSIAVVNALNNKLFVMDVQGLPGGYGPETLAKIALVAKRWKVNQIVVESNFGDGMFTELLKPILAQLYPVTVEEVRHSVQKEKRILDTLEPVIQGHRLVVNKAVVTADRQVFVDCSDSLKLTYQLFHQLTRLTRERGCLTHDDRIDALAIAVSYFTARWGKEAEDSMAERQQAELDEMIARFDRTIAARREPKQAPNFLDLLN